MASLIIEGDKQKFTLSIENKHGLVIADYNWYLTTKNKVEYTTRIIDKLIPESEISLTDGILDFDVTLLPADTASVTQEKMFCDIVAINKTDSTIVKTVWQGEVAAQITVRRDGDVAPTSPDPVLVLRGSDFENAVPFGQAGLFEPLEVNNNKFFNIS